MGSRWQVIPRAVACFLAGLTLINIVGEWRVRWFDANLWWIDLRPLPVWVSRILLLGVSGILLQFALARNTSSKRKRRQLCASLFLAVAALENTLHFYWLVHSEEVQTSWPVPLSLGILLALFIVMAGIVKAAPVYRWNTSRKVGFLLVLMMAGILFPLAQMFCFGETDYRRDADVIVVLGCKTFADGRPSHALADRVLTACELYHEGRADYLIMSGGPGGGDVHETEAMQQLAIEHGVPAEVILLDKDGLNTQATVENTTALCREREWNRVLVVSHFYHLPRIKLSYQREHLEVWTVPATERYRLVALNYYLMREVAAFWVYFLRPLAE